MKKLEDKTIICRSCEEPFVWPARYSSTEPTTMKTMTVLRCSIAELETVDKNIAQELKEKLERINATDIELGTSNSQEAFIEYGYRNDKVRCPKCSLTKKQRHQR